MIISGCTAQIYWARQLAVAATNSLFSLSVHVHAHLKSAKPVLSLAV